MAAGAARQILPGVVNPKDMRLGLVTDSIAVAHKRAHGLGRVLIAAGHRSRKRVDDHKHDGLVLFELDLVNHCNQSPHVRRWV